MENLISSVIKSYRATESLKETAKLCEISEGKVRRILLTNGIMPDSDLTREINGLSDSGMGVGAIAAKFKISANAVMAHLPYSKGMYRADSPTANALRVRRHRDKGVT